MTTGKITVLLAIYFAIFASCDVRLSSGNEAKSTILGPFSSSWERHRRDLASEHRSDIIKLINTRFTRDTVLSRQKRQDLFSGGKQLIFPGTKWCGNGNIAKHYNDLGYFQGTDRCCRAHDYCEPSIEPGETMYGLRNNGTFTRKDCKCDEQFRFCLLRVRSIASRMVGMTYFTILRNKCFTCNQTCYTNSPAIGNNADRIRYTETNNTGCQFCDTRPFEVYISISDILRFLFTVY